MNPSNTSSESPLSFKERRRSSIACTNCRLRKLKVSKFLPKVSYSCSHYPSVVHSQLMMPLVSAVSKKEFSANIVPSTQVQLRMTILLIMLIRIPPSTFIISIPLELPQEGIIYPTKHSTRPCRHLSSLRISRFSRRIVHHNFHILICFLPNILFSPTTNPALLLVAIHPTHIHHIRLRMDTDLNHTTTTGKILQVSSNTR